MEVPEPESVKIGRILDEKFEKEFGYLNIDLNRWCIPMDSVLNDGIQLDFNGPISMSKGTRQDGAFSLKPPISGHIKHVTIPTNELEDILVFRYLISYEDAKRIALENKGDMKAVVYTMLHYLKEAKGYGPETLTLGSVYATFKRPGSSTTFFRYTGDYAGYELRLYSDCTKVKGGIIPMVNYKVVV